MGSLNENRIKWFVFCCGILLLLNVPVLAQLPITSCKKVNQWEFNWFYLYDNPPKDGIVIKSHTLSGSEGGYTFDLFSLDNSFNIKINGTWIAEQEIQFQANKTPNTTPNIRFVDNDRYGIDVKDVYNLKGNNEYPILRVKISATGEVSMFGVKKSYGELKKLELFNGNSFSRVNWYSSKKNTVVFKQSFLHTTAIEGNGYGIACSLFLVASDINQTIAEQSIKGNVLTNDKGKDLQVISMTSKGGNGIDQNITLGVETPVYTENNELAGRFEWHNKGSYTFIPDKGFSGKITIYYKAKDQNNYEEKTSLKITVIPKVSPIKNNPPIAQNDLAYAYSESTFASNILNNDMDPDDDQLTVGSFKQGSKSFETGQRIQVSGTDMEENQVEHAGFFSMKTDGDYEFEPEVGFLGIINPILYVIKDGKGASDQAELRITVLENEDNQTFANDDANAVPKRKAIFGNILHNDNDPEGDQQNVIMVTVKGQKYSLSSNEIEIPISNVGNLRISKKGAYKFVPKVSFKGTLPVVYQIIDEGTPPVRSSATLYLTTLDVLLIARDDAQQEPRLGASVNLNVVENDLPKKIIDPATVSFTDSGATDTDNDGDFDRLAISGEGIWKVNEDGVVTFDPDPLFIGDPKPIGYKVKNEVGEVSNEAVIEITYEHHPPVAVPDRKSNQQIDVEISINAVSNDKEGNGGAIDPTSISMIGPSGSLAYDVNGDGRIDKLIIHGQGKWLSRPGGSIAFIPEVGFYGSPDPIKYTVLDQMGQESNPAEVSVFVNNKVYIPNMFSPNGDGNNDIWKVYSTTIQQVYISIYNQYGQRIFESKNENSGWDGSFKNVVQPTGVYVYYVKITFMDGTEETKKGSITLIR